MVQVFTFPRTINETSARIVAAGVIFLSLAGVFSGSPLVIAVLAAGFWLRLAFGPKEPWAFVVTRFITPRLPFPAKIVAGTPKRFAQGMGAAMSTAALLLSLFGLGLFANIVLGAIIVAASLEAGLAFCIGCKIFGFIQRNTGRGPICTDC